MTLWPPGVFVVGTDTGVGKTRVAAALARTWMASGRRVGVLKPVSSGAARVDGVLRSADVVALAAAITTEGSPFPPPPLDHVGPLVYEAPLAPPVAARAAGEALDPARVIEATESSLAWWADTAGAELMVVEGVGGLLCPLAEWGWTVADLAIHLDYPLIIVAHRGLGTLNHTLLTVEAARARGLRVAGVILNAARVPEDHAAEATNATALVAALPEPPVALLADWGHAPDRPFVPVAPEAGNWLDLAQPPRRLHAIPNPAGAGIVGPGRPTLASSDDEILADPDAAQLLGPSSSGSSSAPAAGPTPPVDRPGAVVRRDPPGTGSGSFNLAIDPDAPRAVPTPGGPAGPGSAGQDDVPGGGTSWRGVVLASYASAVTLALGWTLYQHRNDRPAASQLAGLAAVEERFTPDGRLGERSRTVAVPAAISAGRLIPIGEARQVGSLRVEPRSIARRNLILERVNLAGEAERRDGPNRAIVLVVRLENRSPDQVFAPVDPAFVRGRSDNIAETFLELADGRKVYPNPLAVESEWTAAGENFGDLRPGESRDVTFATDGDAPADAERVGGTWRIKLRTGVGSTATVGVGLPARGKP